MFLHDLKLVDPKELYSTSPLLNAEADHVPASYADGSQKAASTKDERRMRYTPFHEIQGTFLSGIPLQQTGHVPVGARI